MFNLKVLVDQFKKDAFASGRDVDINEFALWIEAHKKNSVRMERGGSCRILN